MSPPSLRGEDMVAVLECREGAVLRHRAAAHTMRLLPGPPVLLEVSVSATA